jgi:hypothetical protein
VFSDVKTDRTQQNDHIPISLMKIDTKSFQNTCKLKVWGASSMTVIPEHAQGLGSIPSTAKQPPNTLKLNSTYLKEQMGPGDSPENPATWEAEIRRIAI